MKKVVLGYLFHREKEWISVFGPDELVFNAYIKKIKAVWTRTHKCYLLPCTKAVAEKLMTDLSKRYVIDVEPLKMALLSKNQPKVKPPKKVKTEKPIQSDDYEKGLRDWELRNA
jgi:hypothetical protein